MFLIPKKKYTLIGFKPEANKAYRKKLLAFGLTPGIQIEVIRVAPMGDPVEVKVRGFSLSLRKEEAECMILSSCDMCPSKGCH